MKNKINSLIILALLTGGAIGVSKSVIEFENANITPNTSNTNTTNKSYSNELNKSVDLTDPTPKTSQSEEPDTAHIFLDRSGKDSSGSFDPTSIPELRLNEGEGLVFGMRFIIDGSDYIGIDSSEKMDDIDLDSFGLYIGDNRFDILHTTSFINRLDYSSNYGGRIGFTLPVYIPQKLADEKGIHPNETTKISNVFGADSTQKVNLSFRLKQSDGSYKDIGIENGGTTGTGLGSPQSNYYDIALSDLGWVTSETGDENYQNYEITTTPLPPKFKKINLLSFDPTIPSVDFEMEYEEGGPVDSGLYYATPTEDITNNLISSGALQIKADEYFDNEKIGAVIWKNDDITPASEIVNSKQEIKVSNLKHRRLYKNFEFSSDFGETWNSIPEEIDQETSTLELEKITSDNFNQVIIDSNEGIVDFDINVKSSGQHVDFDPSLLNINLYSGTEIISSTTSTDEEILTSPDTDESGFGIDHDYIFTVKPTEDLNETPITELEVEYNSDVVISEDENLLQDIASKDDGTGGSIIIDQDGEDVSVDPGTGINWPLKTPKAIDGVNITTTEEKDDAFATINVEFHVPETEDGYKETTLSSISFIDVNADESTPPLYEEVITTTPGEDFNQSFEIPMDGKGDVKEVRVNVQYANPDKIETIGDSIVISTSTLINKIVKSSVTLENGTIKFTGNVSGDVNNIQMAYGEDWEAALKLESNFSETKTAAGVEYNMEFSGLEPGEYDLSKLLVSTDNGTTSSSLDTLDKDDPIFDETENPELDNVLDNDKVIVMEDKNNDDPETKWWLLIIIVSLTVIGIALLLVWLLLFKKKDDGNGKGNKPKIISIDKSKKDKVIITLNQDSASNFIEEIKGRELEGMYDGELFDLPFTSKINKNDQVEITLTGISGDHDIDHLNFLAPDKGSKDIKISGEIHKED